VRLVVIGDVGVLNGMVHIGDEAMFEQLVHQMRERGFTEFVGVSANPAETAQRYGIESVGAIGFGGLSRDAAEQRMELVTRTATGETGLLAGDDPALAVLAAVAGSDAVAVSGGGNLASTWPMHIFERTTIALIAEAFEKPFVVSGQTIGPHLDAADRTLVHRLLSSARLVGLRESDSNALCLDLGVDARLLTTTTDDASFLAAHEAVPATERQYCLVSLSTHVGGESRQDFVRRIAELLDHIAGETGLEIVFFAHFASLDADESRGDSVIHDEVRARMTTTARVEPTTDSAAAARLARGAALVVSSRYHPAVFAVSAGVPTIGIPVDCYTTTKLTGALGNFGQSALVSASELVAGAAPVVASTVWEERASIRRNGITRSVNNLVATADWWDRVAAELSH
jgi:polysaccharide pyruvyl transferase WcaK-like protein